MKRRRFSLGRLAGLLRKEFLQILRDPSSIVIALVMPAVLLLVNGYGISLDAKNVTFGIVDENRSVESAGFYQAFANSPYFKPAMFLDTRAAEAALMRGDIQGYAVLRGDFSRQVSGATEPPAFAVIVNGVDANTARIVVGYAQGAAVTWGLGRLAEQARLPGGLVSLESRYWFNPEIRSTDFIVPGLIALIVTLIGALLTALVVAREWERGTMEALMVSPASMGEILLSKLFANFVLGMGGLAVSVAVGVFLFDVPFRGSLPVLVLISAVFLVAALGMGLLISTAARNQFVAAQVAFIATYMPALILSGLLFDIESMPRWLQAVTQLIAARYYVSSLQTLFLAGTVWPILLPCLASLCGFAAFFLAAALLRTRRSLE